METLKLMDSLFVQWGGVLIGVGMVWSASRAARSSPRRQTLLWSAAMVFCLSLMTQSEPSEGPFSAALKLLVLFGVIYATVRAYRATQRNRDVR
jgi:hypothetical protein